MKYERITMKNIDVGIVINRKAITLQGLLERLFDLEEKIESGELIEAPKGAVVLTPEERDEEMRLCNEERKQAVKEFAERVKMEFYYEFDELIPSIMADRIDELVAESLANELKPFIREE